MPTTVRGVPYPAPTEANNVPVDLQALADWLDANVASLDAGAKILSSQLPAIVLNETFSVADQAAMLALVAQPGDVAIRADVAAGAGRFLLTEAPSTALGNWIRLLLPTDGVVSVDGRVGAVTLADLYAALAHTHTAAQVASGVLATARLGSGVAAAGKYVDGAAGAWTDLPAPLLARVEHNPASLTTYSTTSTIPVPVAAGLQVTFVATTTQASILLSAVAGNATTTNVATNWSLLLAGANVVGSNIEATHALVRERVTASVRVTGLVVGTSYTFVWAHRNTVASAGANLRAGGGNEFSGDHYGPAIMEARAA